MTVILQTNKWPLQKDRISFYGDPTKKGWLDKNTTMVEAPWQLKYGGRDINHIIIHVKCADSLKRVLDWTWEKCDKSRSKIIEYKFDLYSGSYVLRMIRGSSTFMSNHAFAAAIDWADRFNPQHAQRHLFTKDTLLIAAFIQESWGWGGFFKGYSVDSMHVESVSRKR